MKKMSVSFALVLICSLGAFAQSTPPVVTPANCQLVRNAKAAINVYKYYWVQNNGSWIQNSVPLASVVSDVPVSQDVDTDCNYQSILTLDNQVVNGQAQTVSIYAHVHLVTAAAGRNPNKVFHASYNVLSDNNRAAFANAYTQDLATKTMGVSFGEEYFNANPNPHSESVDISVWFQDQPTN